MDNINSITTYLRQFSTELGERSPGELSIIGIEQNPATNSRWAALARDGKQIMQFRCNGRNVANVCEGDLLRYPAWKGMGLPE